MVRWESLGGGRKPDPLWLQLCAELCLTLCDPVDGSPQVPLSLDFPGQNTAEGCHFLLQGIFLTQRSNLVSPAMTGRFFTTAYLGSPVVWR